VIEIHTTKKYLPPWRTACLLCSAGMRDEALVYLVANTPFSSPSDPDLVAVSERKEEHCVLALDENVLWCRLAVPQAERIVRLLRSGRLTVLVHAFEPNNPQVLSGARARLLPADEPLAGLMTARRQPLEGFSTPHRVRASLGLGPRADVEAIRTVLWRLNSPAPKVGFAGA
jgi:hypothetical protein